MKCRLIPRPILERLQTCRRAVFDFRGKIKLLWIFSFLSVKEKYFGIFIEITWISRDVKRQARKKQKLFNKAKSTQKAEDWTAYRTHQKQLQKVCRNNYWSFQNSMFEDTSDKSNKSFWKFINSKKQEPTNVSTLKIDIKIIFDSRGKANAFNDQFRSVFTCENSSNIPDLGESSIPSMAPIKVTNDGVLKLLQSLNIKKATGPDSLPARILREFATEIAPMSWSDLL